MAVPQLLPGFLAKDHLFRTSFQLRLSANDKGNKEVILEAVHRSLGIYPTTEKNPGNLQLGGCATCHRLKWGPLPQNDFDRIVRNVGEGDGREEEKNILAEFLCYVRFTAV